MAVVKVTVLFFAKSRELIGEKKSAGQFPGQTKAQDLYASIVQQFPLLEPIKDVFALAINEEYLDRDETVVTLIAGDEIAVIPPLSGGGMDDIYIGPDRLSVDKATDKVTSPTSGAVSVFVGTTRNNFEGKTVLKLEYEAYEGMAEKELRKICAKIREKWDVENISIYHRLGEVPICEASVVIAISSPHRRASLDAVSYAIDTLKATVPIWKKEVYAEGPASWKENKECHWLQKDTS